MSDFLRAAGTGSASSRVEMPASSVATNATAAPRHGTITLREARVRGWSIGADGAPSALRLLAGAVAVPMRMRRLDRPDLLRPGPGQPPQPVGFVAELLPAVWQQADARGRVALQPELDGRPAGPLLWLDASSLATWQRALAGWKPPDEREVWRLLSHVAASGRLSRLPRRAADWILAAARSRGLEAAVRERDADGRIARGAALHLRVDHLRPLEIEGWMLEPSGATPALALSCNGHAVTLEPAWLDRPDLERVLHAPPAPRGFRIEWPTAIWALADAQGACALRLEIDGRRVLPDGVRVDAQALRAECAALASRAHEHDPAARGETGRRLARLRAHADAIAPGAGWRPEDAGALDALARAFDDGPAAADTDATRPPALQPLRSNLEAWDQLILQGWAFDEAAGGEVFALECNGHPVEIYVERTTRVDASRALHTGREFLGFEIQVPADVWRLADERGTCHLTLRVNGAAIHPAPLPLDGAAIERALVRALPDDDGPLPSATRVAGMRLRLTSLPLLLEHIAARGGAAGLSAPARVLLDRTAQHLAVGALLGLGAPTLAPAEVEREQAIRRQRVWRLQRLLNAQIERRGGRAPGVLAAALDEVLADPDATGPVRADLLRSITSLYCTDPAFERIARELPMEAVGWLAETGDNWSRSIHLAFLAQAGELPGLATQLGRIAETPMRGWINTECVAFAVRTARDSPRVDDAGLQSRAAIVRAFVRLLDRLPGDAWSRLHDRELLEASADLLVADGPWPDDLAHDLVRVALHCFGLVPQFWARVGAGADGLAGDEQVRAARADFDRARAALRALDARERVPADLPAVLDGLHAWHVRGQRDALQWLRELVLQALAVDASAAHAADPALDRLRARLPEWFEAGDRRRFEALPGASLRARARSLHGLERRVAADRALLEGAPAAAAAAPAIAAACARLARTLPALCTPATGFRGAPLLAGIVDEAARVGADEATRAALRSLAATVQAAQGRAAHASTDEASAERGDAVEPSLWPTTDTPDPELARGGNRLRLLTSADRLRRLDDARLLVVCVVRNERPMLPHFLAHHRALGATAFVLVDNLSDDGTREYLAEQPDVVLYSVDTDYRDSHFGVSWQQAVLAAHAQGKWALLVDADELLLYRDCEHLPLPALLDRLEAAGHDAALTPMIDMYPRRALREVDFGRDDPVATAGWFDRAPLLRWHLGGGLYSNAPTWVSALRHRLIPHSPPNAFTAQKLALLRWRPWLRLSEGLHYATGATPAPEALFLGHFKYHAGFREKVLREVERKQHFDNASEYAHYLHLVAEPDASLFEAGVSVPFDGSGALPGGVAP